MLGSILIYVGNLHIRHLHLEIWHNLFIMCPHLHVLLGDIFSLLDVNTDDNLFGLINGSFTKVPKLDGDVPTNITLHKCGWVCEIFDKISWATCTWVPEISWQRLLELFSLNICDKFDCSTPHMILWILPVLCPFLFFPIVELHCGLSLQCYIGKHCFIEGSFNVWKVRLD